MREFPNLHFLPIDSDAHGTTLQYVALITLLKNLGDDKVLEWVDGICEKNTKEDRCEKAGDLSDAFVNYISLRNDCRYQSELERVFITELQCTQNSENIITSADIPARLSGVILIWGFGLCGEKLYSSIMEKCGNYNERNFYVFDKNYDVPEEVSSVKNSDLEYFIKQHKNMLTVIISVQNSSVQKDIAESLTQQYGLKMESILFYRNIKR